jgi:methyl-accepting chemotaxis protein
MNFLNNIKTSRKLISCFIIVAIFSIVVGGVGFSNMSTINDKIETIYTDRLVPINFVSQISSSLWGIRGDVYKVILLPAEREKTKGMLAANVDKLTKNLEAFKSSNLTTAEQDELIVFETAWNDYHKGVDQVVVKAESGDSEGALDLLKDDGKTALARRAVSASIDKLSTINNKTAQVDKLSAENTFSSSSLVILIVTLAAFILAIVFGIVISTSISKPLGKLVAIARLVAKGDLVRDLDQKEKLAINSRKDEIGDIGQAFASVVEYMQIIGAVAEKVAGNDLTVEIHPLSEKDETSYSLQRMVKDLRNSVGQIDENSRRLATTSRQLAEAAN